MANDAGTDGEAGQVADYLRRHPQFFVDHDHLLADLVLPHPKIGTAISLAERQQRVLREKNAQLEARLRQLIQYGTENDAISEKMHRLGLALLETPDADRRVDLLYRVFQADFALPHIALRVWGPSAVSPGRPERAAVSHEAMTWIHSSVTPFCGHEVAPDMLGWFAGGGAAPRSFAAIALGGAEPYGLLLLGSPDPKRFYPGIGKVFLGRLGDLVGAALADRVG